MRGFITWKMNWGMQEHLLVNSRFPMSVDSAGKLQINVKWSNFIYERGSVKRMVEYWVNMCTAIFCSFVPANRSARFQILPYCVYDTEQYCTPATSVYWKVESSKKVHISCSVDDSSDWPIVHWLPDTSKTQETRKGTVCSILGSIKELGVQCIYL